MKKFFLVMVVSLAVLTLVGCRTSSVVDPAAAAHVALMPCEDGIRYWVDQRGDGRAADATGSESAPFKTISAAAAVVKAGDLVVIQSGVYRESVTIKADGTTERPIRFQAAPGARVVVTGANQLKEWRREAGEANIFSTPWPHRFLAWNKAGTHPSDDLHKMVGRCEQVFVNGYPMLQVLERPKLSHGTFYVDLEGQRLYVWERANRDLLKSKLRVEASVRPVIWTSHGRHVQIRGLCFRYAANQAQHGGVKLVGDYGVAEDCVFERMNSVGLSFTGQHVVVRRCTITNNGQLGFKARKSHHARMFGCTVQNNNVKGFSRGWEAGGNKIVLCRDMVIAESRFIANRGNGVWFDIGNEDCVVKNCLIADNEHAGIFYEISFGLHAHDNVIVGNGFDAPHDAWAADGGVSLSSSPGCVVERNLLVGNRGGLQFREQRRATATIAGDKGHGVAIWNHDQVIRHNVLAYNDAWQVGAWFDVTDGRHWPRAMRAQFQKGDNAQRANDADIAKEYLAKDSEGQPVGLGLEELNFDFRNNLYALSGSQGLIQWGAPWRDHRCYSDLNVCQRELSLETGSRVAAITFADYLTRDFRVPAGSPIIEMGCYPKGDVPGVRLGMIAERHP
jgi:hypothetical protein